jgi:hypothetical protein
MAAFDSMMDNPAQYEADHPELTLEDIVQVHESIYLLKQLQERWRRWVLLFKSVQLLLPERRMQPQW